MNTIKIKSDCCNSDIIPSKGSCLGQTNYICWNCKKIIPLATVIKFEAAPKSN